MEHVFHRDFYMKFLRVSGDFLQKTPAGFRDTLNRQVPRILRIKKTYRSSQTFCGMEIFFISLNPDHF
jgi:hypothetical protein